MLTFLNLAIASKFAGMFLVTFVLLSLVTKEPGSVAKVFTKVLLIFAILSNVFK